MGAVTSISTVPLWDCLINEECGNDKDYLEHDTLLASSKVPANSDIMRYKYEVAMLYCKKTIVSESSPNTPQQKQNAVKSQNPLSTLATYQPPRNIFIQYLNLPHRVSLWFEKNRYNIDSFRETIEKFSHFSN